METVADRTEISPGRSEITPGRHRSNPRSFIFFIIIIIYAPTSAIVDCFEYLVLIKY